MHANCNFKWINFSQNLKPMKVNQNHKKNHINQNRKTDELIPKPEEEFNKR